MKKHLINAFVAAGLASQAFTSPALAEGPPPPADAELLGKKAVGVLPVLAPGQSRTQTYQTVASRALASQGKAAIATPRSVAKLEAGQGFGFAGASTEADLMLQQVGFLVASLALEVEHPATFAETVQTLGQARELFASLTPEVTAAYDRYLAAGKTGAVDVVALATLMAEAEAGIAKGPARAHGYLAGGMWFGLGMITASTGEADPSFIAMARPLAVMFEEDASFEGSDRTIAAALREAARALAVDPIDIPAFKAALTKAFGVAADQPAP